MKFYFLNLKRIGKILQIILFIGVLFVCYYSMAEAEFVKVIDGDSLEIGTRRIRLQGIDAPEYKQYCYDARGKKYNCGKEARKYLKSMLEQVDFKVSCRTREKDRYGRELATCYANGKNLNLAMLESGWAVTYRTEKRKYTEAEKQAQKEKNGVWQGKFMRPEYYRRLYRQKNR